MRCPFLGGPEYPDGVTISLFTLPTRASSPPASLSAPNQSKFHTVLKHTHCNLKHKNDILIKTRLCTRA